jgi:hypothetical protein
MGTSGDVWEVVWRGYWEIEKGERERERVGLKVFRRNESVERTY